MARRIRLLLGAALVLCAPARGDAGDLLQNGTERGEPEALSFLKSLPREWSGSSKRDCKTYEDKNIDRLVGAFAVASAGLLRAFVEVHGQVTITSAYRSSDEQACVCEGEKGPCAGRPHIVKRKKGRRIVKHSSSQHQHGIALDVRAGTGSDAEFACMHEFAQLNPQFGVRFPLGQRDRPHMEPAAMSAQKVRIALLGALHVHITPCSKLKTMLTDTPVD